jgi:aspartate-semialdehyde dehydrogenase
MFTVAILGASGAVGQELLRTLEQRQFPIRELRLLASERSAGKKFPFRGRMVEVQKVSAEAFRGVQIGLFSAGGSVSAEWAPIAAQGGRDRGGQHQPLPHGRRCAAGCAGGERRPAHAARPPAGIIANPNCSTIQMVQVLDPLHRAWGLRRVVVSTYQSTSGKGAAAMQELERQSIAALSGETEIANNVFPHRIAFNVLPHIDSFTENGYTKEELKMLNETRKIMRAPDECA